MIILMMERPIPPGFDPMDDAQASRHARIAVDAMAKVGGMRWRHSYVTGDKLFGVVEVDTEETLARYQAAAGIAGQSIVVHRVRRVLDASLAT